MSIIRYFILFCAFFVVGFIGLVVYKNTNFVTKVFAPTSYFSLQNPPKNSLKGEIISLSGDVLWESRVATEASKISKPQIIQQGESISTGKNGSVSVEFTKIALFSLGPSSNLNIIQNLPQDIVVEETSGNVEYSSTGISPFSIKTLGLLINSKSNANFSVKVNNQQVEINLSTGSLALAYTDTNNTSQVVRLNAHQQLIYDDNTKEITLK